MAEGEIKKEEIKSFVFRQKGFKSPTIIEGFGGKQLVVS